MYFAWTARIWQNEPRCADKNAVFGDRVTDLCENAPNCLRKP